VAWAYAQLDLADSTVLTALAKHVLQPDPRGVVNLCLKFPLLLPHHRGITIF